MIKVTEYHGSANKPGKNWIARDVDHAQRIITKRRALQAPGSSNYYGQQVLTPTV